MSTKAQAKRTTLTMVLLSILLAALGCQQQDGNGYLVPGAKTILQQAQSTPGLESFYQAALQADLGGKLNGIGPYTVFAPSNEAFDRMPGGMDSLLDPKNREHLMVILNRHVSFGAIYAENARDLGQTMAIDGTVLTFSRGAAMGEWEFDFGRYGGRKNISQREKFEYLTVNGAAVVRPDLVCSNGVIHIIDRVLMP